MKKLLLLITLFFSVNMLAANDDVAIGQRVFKTDRSMSISLSPFQLFLASLDGKYAIKVSENVAMTVPFVIQYTPRSARFSEIFHISLGAGVQFSLSNSAYKNGFYLEPRLSLGYGRITPPEIASLDSLFLKKTLLCGYNWAFSKAFFLNLAAGVFYNHAFSDEAPVIKKALLDRSLYASGITSGFGPVAEVSLGYHW